MRPLSRLPKAVQQSALYALALGGAKGVSLLMVPVFTHYLSPADYGRLDVLQTLADILSIVIGLGLADTLFRFCQDDDPKRARHTAAQLLGLSWLIAVFAFILTQMAAPLITQALPGAISEVQIRLILTSLSLSGTILVPLAWFRFRAQAHLYVIGSLGRTVFQAALAALFLVIGLGLSGFVLAGLIACLTLSLLGSWLQLRETGIRFDLFSIKRFGPYGGPLIFAGFAGFIMGSFDRWILAGTLGPAAMADYALAAKFALITAVLVQPYDMWWQARRFSVLKAQDGEQTCVRFSSVAVLIVSAAVITVSSLSVPLIHLLTPESYHGAVIYVPYLVGLAALHNLTQTLGFGIYTEKTTRLPAFIDGGSAALALVGYGVLIPGFGIMGAIWATALALGVRFCVTVFLAQRVCKLAYPLWKYLGLAGFCLVYVLFLQGQSDPVFLAVSLGCGLLILSGLGVGFGFVKGRQRRHDTPKTA